MGKEFELKFRASVKQMTAIMEEYAGFREITMETVYFDTYEDALSQRKWMLRRRMENGVAVCTLKTPGENGVRNEWEVPCDDIAAAIPELCKLGAPAELESLTAKGLPKVGSARLTRQPSLRPKAATWSWPGTGASSRAVPGSNSCWRQRWN